MVVFKRRTRMISFRLFEDEYEAFKGSCAAAGVRSLSDFARLAVCQMIDPGAAGPRDGFQNSITKLNRTIQQLDEDIKLLTLSMQQVGAKASKQDGPAGM